MEVAQSCLILFDTMDCVVHGILQARVLEWVAFPFSRVSSHPRDWTQVSCIVGELLLMVLILPFMLELVFLLIMLILIVVLVVQKNLFFFGTAEVKSKQRDSSKSYQKDSSGG